MKIQYWDRSKGQIYTICKDRDIKAGYFANCTIEGINCHYPQPLIKTNGELLLPTIERFMSLGRGTIYEDTMEWECKNNQITKTETNPVFYFVYNCANYFHWIYDTVSYLYVYFKEREKNKNLKLLISPPYANNTDLYPFVYETLALLGITKKDLIFLDPNTRYEQLIIGSSLTHNRMSLESPHKGLRNIIESMKGSSSDKEKIYISRRTWTKHASYNIGTDYTKERMCTNEDDVVRLFQQYGFEEVFCEDYSMKDKIGLFRSAKVVAGPIGGGMSNILFCQPTTKVLSINSPEFLKVNKRLLYALSHTNLHHFDHTEFVNRKKDTISTIDALSISGGMNSPWKVDLNKLQQKLQKL